MARESIVRQIQDEQLAARLRDDNPWWDDPNDGPFVHLTPRAYFNLLFPLVQDTAVRRAVVLLGPRRVGKTVLIHHLIDALIAEGIPPKQLVYFSVDHPVYHAQSLESLLDIYLSTGEPDRSQPVYVFFDEVQYLKDWEVHVKAMVDRISFIKVTVSGSAAAALKAKSEESGAGRFTDFLLPPLTFYEYLRLTDQEAGLIEPGKRRGRFKAVDIDGLNERFLHYLNFGGYPEVVFSPQIQENPGRFVKQDIIDKVLLRDLPTLYGISDIPELNRLFTSLAFNTANELSWESLSQGSGVSKTTLRKYITYLEAAFLIRSVNRVAENARRFKRARTFKVYLTNPSMRAALFAPVAADDKRETGPLAETAIFSQWFHSNIDLYYARWKEGREVDIVGLDPGTQKAAFAVEVKWSDRYFERPSDLGALREFCGKSHLEQCLATTYSKVGTKSIGDLKIEFIPTAVYCYMLGHNIIAGKTAWGIE